jgi:hypothetical protein
MGRVRAEGEQTPEKLQQSSSNRIARRLLCHVERSETSLICVCEFGNQNPRSFAALRMTIQLNVGAWILQLLLGLFA